MAEFLLEIGLEEIPARMIAAAENELGARIRELITREQLSLEDDSSAGGLNSLVIGTYSTPRRLAVHALGLAATQADTEEPMTGPSWSVAFKDGVPTPAAHAFAKKSGVAVEAFVKTITPKGDYVSATIHRRGRTAAEVFATELPKEIAALSWPKNMYWRPGKPERYVRPIKWLLALFDHAIVPVEFAGVHAANLTYGHRILHGQQAVTIHHPGDYLAALASAKVMADVAARRHTIRKALDHATRTVTNARWREDEPLIETVTHLTEWPSVVLGSFEPEYLALPEEVLVTVMRDHQKYFAVEDADSKLAPHFLAVLNTQADAQGIIRHGNERVLRARFNDARFFWNFDQKISLDDRVELLKAVTFQKDLGNYYHKTQRTAAIADALSALVPAAHVPSLNRAVTLAKVDLTTELVKEFTELQGIVGGLYARAAGEDEKVVSAIYSQYQPAAVTDPIPLTIEGQLLGLADRIGTIVDMFELGLAPTGSKDPFALRRAGNAIIKILVESDLPITLFDLYGTTGSPQKGEGAALTIGFLFERLEFYLREVRQFSFDVVGAVLSAPGTADVRDVVSRANALSAVRTSDDFAAISAAFKRSNNILFQASKGNQPVYTNVHPPLLTEPAEQALYAAVTLLSPAVERLRQQCNYAAALEQIATLRPYVDRFFDEVMVMVDDEQTRTNRLTLLAFTVGEFSKIADFSAIVPAGA